MCGLLTLLNLPLVFIFSAPAGRRGVSFFDLQSLFEHFSLGNIGRLEPMCQVSHLDYE